MDQTEVFIGVEAEEKSNCAMNDVNSLTFLLKEVESVQSNLLQTIDFHHGYKGKFLSPRFNFGSLVEAWQRVCIYCSEGQGRALVLSQAVRTYDILMLFSSKEKKQEWDRNKKMEILALSNKLSKSHFRREHCHFYSAGLNKHWQVLAGMGEELIIAKHYPDEHCQYRRLWWK